MLMLAGTKFYAPEDFTNEGLENLIVRIENQITFAEDVLELVDARSGLDEHTARQVRDTLQRSLESGQRMLEEWQARYEAWQRDAARIYNATGETPAASCA
jgi:hypothetical protein